MEMAENLLDFDYETEESDKQMSSESDVPTESEQKPCEETADHESLRCALPDIDYSTDDEPHDEQDDTIKVPEKEGLLYDIYVRTNLVHCMTHRQSSRLKDYNPEATILCDGLVDQSNSSLPYSDGEEKDTRHPQILKSPLGRYMENYISCYGVCPVCKEHSLRKYLDNVPGIDLVCTNTARDHSLSTRFFKIIASLGELPRYFNLDIDDMNRYVTLTSMKEDLPDPIKVKDHINKIRNYFDIEKRNMRLRNRTNRFSGAVDLKHVLIGYICILAKSYNNVERCAVGNRCYRISRIHSGVLMPISRISDLTFDTENTYYNYKRMTQATDPLQIEWDDKYVQKHSIKSCFPRCEFQRLKVFSSDINFKEVIIINPLCDKKPDTDGPPLKKNKTGGAKMYKYNKHMFFYLLKNASLYNNLTKIY